MDIGKLKNNEQYCAWWPEPEVVLSLKENPEFNLHIWDGYFTAIFANPISTDDLWVGFTRDYQENKGGWDKAAEIENIEEYIWDILRYKDRRYDPIWERASIYEVLELIVDFLTYAKQTNQTVIVEVQ